MKLGDNEWKERLQAKLEPDAMALAFIRADTLLTGYELVKSSILNDVEGFFVVGFDENAPFPIVAFQSKVMPLGRNKLKPRSSG